MKYEVTLKEFEVYSVEVEADNEDDALRLAYEAIETEEGKAKHHNDSDGEYEVYEVE